MSLAYRSDYNAAQSAFREAPLVEKDTIGARRSRVTPSPIRSEEDEDESREQSTTRRNSLSSMWEQRRRRKEARAQKEYAEESNAAASKEQRKNRLRNNKQKKKDEEEEEDEIDPYDSDPGESYRQHCLKAKVGSGSRTCMGVPNFLLSRKSIRHKDSEVEDEEEEDTVLTSPPSPLASDMGDPYGQLPPSLPRNAAIVRYSLRSSVTDGSERQPIGPSVMERRELRPNNVHLNVSHWSDAGGRAYMEDRYVSLVLDCFRTLRRDCV